jgi:UDP-N-acetylmuramyl tripeptide synthase
MAVATARELGVPVADAIAATDSVASVGERSPQLPTPSGRDATLVLAKNPAGWAALIEDLCDRDVDIVFVQNDNAADGRDPSWIWDVDFERLAPRHVVASGTRALDVAVRTQTAGLDVVAIEPDPRRAVEIADRGRELVVAASYTAFFDLARSRHR